MIKVLVVSLNMKAYLISATVAPVMRQVMGNLPAAPRRGGPVILPEIKQVRDILPMLYVVLEDGQAGLVNLNDVVPLLSEEQKQDLESTEVPADLRAQAEQLVKKLSDLEQAEQGAEQTTAEEPTSGQEAQDNDEQLD